MLNSFGTGFLVDSWSFVETFNFTKSLDICSANSVALCWNTDFVSPSSMIIFDVVAPELPRSMYFAFISKSISIDSIFFLPWILFTQSLSLSV